MDSGMMQLLVTDRMAFVKKDKVMISWMIPNPHLLNILDCYDESKSPGMSHCCVEKVNFPNKCKINLLVQFAFYIRPKKIRKSRKKVYFVPMMSLWRIQMSFQTQMLGASKTLVVNVHMRRRSIDTWGRTGAREIANGMNHVRKHFATSKGTKY